MNKPRPNVSDACTTRPTEYAAITHGAVKWLLAHQFRNGTIPYIIDPPDLAPHGATTAYLVSRRHTHMCLVLDFMLLPRVSVHLLQRRVFHRLMAALRSVTCSPFVVACRHLVRAGADVLPQLHQLNATIDYLLAKQVRC